MTKLWKYQPQALNNYKDRTFFCLLFIKSLGMKLPAIHVLRPAVFER